MKCLLCKNNEADKPNTHYLSDNIIRLTLNEDGSNEREKGFYFDVSTDNVFVDFNFQRNTSPSKIEGFLQREISEEEIENAKSTTPFSVDYKFCSECEKEIFTKIENAFNEKILPKFRNSDLNNLQLIKFENENEIKILRLYFYMQIWRTSVCTDDIKISEESKEILRTVILNFESVQLDDIKIFPLCIIYLETNINEKTGNIVGTSEGNNPSLIFMNDFIIQFFESEAEVYKLDFHGLNDFDFDVFLNMLNIEFKVKILSNEKRNEFLNSFYNIDKVEALVSEVLNRFMKCWQHKCNHKLPLEVAEDFVKSIAGSDNITNLSEEFINSKIEETIRKNCY